jgi:hypothetical protein
MKGIVAIPAFAFTLLLAGCSEPTIDASSEEAFTESAAQVLESLDGSDQEEFTAALMVLAMSNTDWSAVFAGETSGEPDLTAMLGELDGMTGDEVIAKGEEARLRREQLARERAERERERRRESLLTQIVELEARQQAAEEARRHLEGFVVHDAHFYVQEERYGPGQPVIDLTVENRTYQPVSRAYFEGVVGSPGRAVPWISESFNYSIPGGIEAGETSTWSLAPNMFSPWGRVEVPEVSYLEVTVVRLDGPDGEPLWDARGLSDREQIRLDSLRAQLQDL